MMRKVLAFGILMLSFMVAGVAGATILSFDNLPDATGYYAPIGTYGGFTWHNMYYLESNELSVTTTGYTLGAVSPYNVAFNGFGNAAQITSDIGLFNFSGMDMTAAFSKGLSVTLTGFAGGVQKYAQTVTLSNTQPNFFNFDFLGVDSLQLTSSGGNSPSFTQVALDNFTFSPVSVTLGNPVGGNDPPPVQNQVAPVPEPGTFLLLALGLGMLLLGGRRLRLG